MPVTVLLADDAEVALHAVRDFLTHSSDIELVGLAKDFNQAVHLANGLRPQVIVMDLHMTQGSPQDVRKSLPLGRSRLLAMSVSNDEHAKSLAESFGASMLLDKMNFSKELVPAIKKLALPIARTVGR